MPLIRVTQRSRTQALLEIRNKETRSFAVLDGSLNRLLQFVRGLEIIDSKWWNCLEIEGKVSRMIDREEREDPRWRGVTTKKEFVVQDSSSTGRTR